MAQDAAPHTKVRRGARRAITDRQTIHDILDANLVASIAFANDGDATFFQDDVSYPTVLPTACVRDGNYLLFHGKRSSLLQQRLANGAPVCVTVFSLDGIVCAKAAMHHSVNYRSVVVYGRAEAVEDDAEKRHALDCITDGVTWPGRHAECRPMSKAEVDATLVTRLELKERNVSCKVRDDWPSDDKADAHYPCWTGNIPLKVHSLPPLDAPHNNKRPKVSPPSTASFFVRDGLISPSPDILPRRWTAIAPILAAIALFFSLRC